MNSKQVPRTSLWLLCIILSISLFLRIYHVATNPPAMSWDEVSIGYNAYSILKTGKDEHGRFLPLDTFVAYGDYKPPLAIYLTVPSVAIFGLSEFAVRLPSVIAGTLTILVVFFLVQGLFHITGLSLLASGVLTLSPWHMQLSRGGFEANIATLFIAFGVWIFLEALKRPRLLLFAFLPFVAAIYTFNSARYFAPFITLALLVFGWSSFRKQKTLLFLGVVVATFCMLPIIPHLLSKEARLRFAEVNIFTQSSVVETANERIASDQQSIVSKILHNRRLGYARSYLIHFFDHFEPWFLFGRGDGNPKFSIQDTGQLYLIELPLLVLGIYWIFSTYPRVGWFLLAWLLGAIIPAATARETPHALRIENSLPTWQIFVAAGIWSLVGAVRKKIRILILLAIVASYIANASYYLHNLFIHYPVEYSGEWQYGYREAIEYAASVKNQYDRVVISDTIGRPYMYALFYEQYDPERFVSTKNSTFDAAGFYHVYGFDTYTFVKGSDTQLLTKTLYILDPPAPPSARLLKTIYKLNGEPALVIFDL